MIRKRGVKKIYIESRENAAAVSRSVLDGVIADHPKLTADGWVNSGRPVSFEDFERACRWLLRVPFVKVPKKSDHVLSYRLKHIAEIQEGGYVSNGAMIAAALALGVALAPCVSGPNSYLAISTKEAREAWRAAGMPA